jgi:hypothetical protein
VHRPTVGATNTHTSLVRMERGTLTTPSPLWNPIPPSSLAAMRCSHSSGLNTSCTRNAPSARVGTPTPRCQIGYVHHTGFRRLVSSSIRPTRVVTPWGCEIGYVDHTGCHRLVFRLQNNVVKTEKCPTLPSTPSTASDHVVQPLPPPPPPPPPPPQLRVVALFTKFCKSKHG